MNLNLKRLQKLNSLLHNPKQDELFQTEMLIEAILGNENPTHSIYRSNDVQQEEGVNSEDLLATTSEVLQRSSRLLESGSIDVALYSKIDRYAVDEMKAEIVRLSHRNSDDGDALPSLEYKSVIFTQPLTFSNINFQRLSFNDCTFGSALHFTGTTSENTIEFTNCSFGQEHELLVRMTSFPKPEQPSSWRPSMSFKNCSVPYLHVIKAELFLFFTDSKIGATSLELSPGSTVQYVDCQVSDGIIHAIDEQRISNGYSGHQLVPKDWYKPRGWTIT